MGNAYLVLVVLALIAFIVGVIDYPPANATRCIALGLFLLTLALLIGR